MSVETPQDNQSVVQEEKERNFAQLRKQYDQERAARLQAEERAAQIEKMMQEKSRPQEDDDDDDEPYVDKKKLQKTLAQFESKTVKTSQSIVQQEVAKALSQERQQAWLKQNPDFYEVMQHAQKLADSDPELAETILEMPEGFERQKLVYKNIKAFGLHKPPQPKESIQTKIDQNRRSPYYQPSGVANAPHAIAGDYSPSGQKNAYAKMQELKERLRLG